MNPLLELRPLRVEDERSFKSAVKEFADQTPPWQFAFHFDPSGDFSEYVRKLHAWSRGLELAERFVPNSYYVGVVDGAIIGRVSIRHELSDFLRRVGGHIGYGVIATERRRGYATEMLRQALPICATLGIRRALVTCDADNIGSRRVIEKCGGCLEGLTDCPDLEVQKRRYWISTEQSGATTPNQDGPIQTPLRTLGSITPVFAGVPVAPPSSAEWHGAEAQRR
jgi:predicted acetyltransferase